MRRQRASAAATLVAAVATLAACTSTGSPPGVPGATGASPGATGPLPAFPGAQGAGMYAQGGRGGRVYTVTHLGDSGSGSLREAVEASGPRTVVFAVSGTIVLQRELMVREGRLTVAGQTAPGDGITLRDHPFTIAADDVVVRFIRSRLGDLRKVDGDAIGVVAGRRIILDHVSASWSTDETLSVAASFSTPQRSWDEVTVQWSLIGESLNRTAAKPPGTEHGFGSLVRAARGARVSFHHNFWLHHQDRMPRPGNYLTPEVDPVGGFFDFRHNLFYNWAGERSGYNMDFRGTVSSYNFVDNCFVRGPISRGAFAFEESSSRAKAYFSGNTMDGVLPADPWTLVRAHQAHLPKGLPADYRQSRPFPMPPIKATPGNTGCEAVVLASGASLVRDAVDQRLVQDYRQRRGRLIDSQTEVGGWPTLRSLPAPRDRDGDGIPDDWETAHGLNPDDARDGAQPHPSVRYTWLEVYLADKAQPAMRLGSAR